MPAAPGSFVLMPEDDAYPVLVREGYEHAPALFGIGSPEALSEPCIAVIGARRATPYGLELASMAGRIAAECGLVVVSGGAMGCDAAASRAALAAGGRTAIVAGSGADRVYPQSSADIFREAPRQGGCIVALETWGTAPRRDTFPKRNRLIAALALALVVTEAGRKSGTMGTAEAAMEMGRSVYAVPGSIFSPTSAGTNYLIANGAAIILDELGLELQISLDYGCARQIQGVPLHPAGRVLSALVASPARASELAGKIGIDAITLAETLSSYAERGLVERLPDGSYAPSRKAYQLLRSKDGT